MGLLDNALQALKSQYEETKGNVGLLASDPKRYMSGLNQDAAEYNRLSSLALQAERNAYRGIPVSQEQAAAKQYIDQQQQDMALGFTGSIKPVGKVGLPSPQSLSMPITPTVEQMKQYGRTEVVPLSKAVSFQSARNWENFNAGKHPGDLVPGYGDKPLALRLETGEYVIYDGNHRTDLALQKGKTEMPMHVIDVKSYDPSVAGRKPAQSKISDDELLKILLGK